MTSHLTWFVGNQNPSITEIITTGGEVVDLTGSSVKFKMRAVGDDTLIVDSAVSNSPGADGVVRYDWASGDVDTAGYYLVWWEVTTGGKTQDMNEAVIEIREHATLTNTYLELEEFKSTTELTGMNFADADIQNVLVSTSRGIDEAFGRRFYLDPNANQVRYYTPAWNSPRLWIDDLVTLTTLKSDDSGDGTFENTWTANTDFVLGPLNAAADGKPYTHIEINPAGSLRWPTHGYPRTIEVTGKFGWPAVPPNVKTLTRLIAGRLLKRIRMSPEGFIGLDGAGAVVRAAGYARDPDYSYLTQGLDRSVPIA